MSTRSGPPAAVTSSASTAVLSVVDGRVSSAIRAFAPLACSVNSSDSAVPTARSVSLPAPPSSASKPSPCSAVSSPLPSSTVSSPPPGWTKSASSPVAIVSAPGPPITVSVPAPDSIVTASVSASAIRIVSAPAPERISTRENVARSKPAPLTSTVVGEVSRSVMLSAALSPVTESVPALTEGMTAASAAAGSETVRTAASRRIRRMRASCAAAAARYMGEVPRPGPGVLAAAPSARAAGAWPRAARS